VWWNEERAKGGFIFCTKQALVRNLALPLRHHSHTHSSGTDHRKPAFYHLGALYPITPTLTPAAQRQPPPPDPPTLGPHPLFHCSFGQGDSLSIIQNQSAQSIRRRDPRSRQAQPPPPSFQASLADHLRRTTALG
jgi:hypothetical protein